MKFPKNLARWLLLFFTPTLPLALSPSPLSAADGNRLTYLDSFCDPYYPNRNFPKLTTPQWVGEPGVEAVVVLAIDDMRGPEKWEAYLRPILDRLKKIDGRAPVSIMTNTVDPAHPHLQTWLREGLSLECHTIDHPCPVLQKGNFAAAKSTYDRCVDQMALIPGGKPVAFRTPCCDSLNTPSPRLFGEIFNGVTEKGNFLQIDSAVFNITTANDPELPRELVMENGRERYRKYVPFKSFVNTIEDYPYPYVVARLGWQFPCAVPSDWQAQNIQQPNNPKTVEDLKAAIDATVIKQGVFNFVFHPHGWIRSDQVVALIDHVERKHGKKVKFLNFREALQRINKNLLAGKSLRLTEDFTTFTGKKEADGSDNGVRLLDVNNDGYMDVIITKDGELPLPDGKGKPTKLTRVWQPKERKFRDVPFPKSIVWRDQDGLLHEGNLRFGVLSPHGRAAFVVFSVGQTAAFEFNGETWQQETQNIADIPALDKINVNTVRVPDRGVRLRDLDGDGICELIVGRPHHGQVYRFDPKTRDWTKLPFTLPAEASIVNDHGHDAGLRFVDIDEDGHDDVLISNGERSALYLFDSMTTGWSRKVFDVAPTDAKAMPPFVRGKTDNGMWVHSRSLWWQNEDTARLRDLVDRRSFNDLLGDTPPRGKTPQASLASMRVRPGLKIELAAAEPLVMDPITFDWGPDGKLWVVEMADYPLGIDGKGKPGGRVRYLEDTNGDGVYDTSKLFLDGLAFPNGVLPWRKGVLVCAAPDIIYAEDTDGDGRADKREVLFTGFRPGNPQHRFNGLVWGLDNWVYLANGDSDGIVVSTKTGQKVNIRGRDLRIKPDEGKIDPQSGQTQFGRARDDWGNWFGCSNPYPCWHFALEDHYTRRNPHVAPPDARSYVPINPMYTPIFPLSRTLARFNDLHTANRITSACGLTIYRDDLLGPEFASSFLVCEPVHNLVHRQVMTPKGSTFTSRRPEDEAEREFLASSDSWFRPTSVRTGPDGAIWIADMHRAVIEHPEWIPDDWEAKLDLRAGADKGRIYRVALIGVPRRPIPRLDKLDTTSLVKALDSPNGWQRDMAQRMLIWRKDRAAFEPLTMLAINCDRPVTRLQALCTLDGLQWLGDVMLVAALDDSHPGVARHAIRLAEPRLGKTPTLTTRLLRLANNDRAPGVDPQVQIQLAYTLAEIRTAEGGAALGTVALRGATDNYLVAAALSSVHRDNIAAVLGTAFAGAGKQESARPLLTRLLKLSAALGQKQAIRDVLTTISRPSTDENSFERWQLAALAGVLDELDRRHEKLTALDWTAESDRATPHRISAMIGQARKVFDAESTSTSDRLVATELLAREPEHATADIARLATLLAPQVTGELQQAAVERLSRVDRDEVAGHLLEKWSGFSPSQRQRILDILLTRDHWTRTLVERIDRGGVAVNDIDAMRRQALSNHRNADVRKLAAKLFGGVNEARQKVLANYRDVLTMAGDRTRGQVVFTQRCATCHRLGEVGHAVGPDLAALTNRSREAMLVAILDPNRAVEDKFVAYAAMTNDGRQLSGILAAETGNSVTLLAPDGRRETVLRTDLDQLVGSGKSLMPEGMENDLSRQALADVMKFVTGQGPKRKEFAGNEPKVIAPAADGTLRLLATNGEIYGTALVFETQYKNLGHWSTADSHAIWTIDLPRAATYRVTLDYACHDSTAGNFFALDAGEAKLTGRVAGTGTWDDYKQVEIGKIMLPAGKRTIVFRPEGAMHDHLIDLRGLTLKVEK